MIGWFTLAERSKKHVPEGTSSESAVPGFVNQDCLAGFFAIQSHCQQFLALVLLAPLFSVVLK